MSPNFNTHKVNHAPIGFEQRNGVLVKTITKVDVSANVLDLVNIDIFDASFKIVFRKHTFSITKLL